MATGGNEQTASPLAEFGSFSVKESAVNYTIHLCQVRDGSTEAYADKVRAVRASALVWPQSYTPPSELPGVEVLSVGDSWDARVDALQKFESKGYRSVAVRAGGGAPRLYLDDNSIKKLSDYAASRQAGAAADIWVLWSETPILRQLRNLTVEDKMDWLSSWQQELSKDARYQRLK